MRRNSPAGSGPNGGGTGKRQNACSTCGTPATVRAAKEKERARCLNGRAFGVSPQLWACSARASPRRLCGSTNRPGWTDNRSRIVPGSTTTCPRCTSMGSGAFSGADRAWPAISSTSAPPPCRRAHGSPWTSPWRPTTAWAPLTGSTPAIPPWSASAARATCTMGVSPCRMVPGPRPRRSAWRPARTASAGSARTGGARSSRRTIWHGRRTGTVPASRVRSTWRLTSTCCTTTPAERLRTISEVRTSSGPPIRSFRER